MKRTHLFALLSPAALSARGLRAPQGRRAAHAHLLGVRERRGSRREHRVALRRATPRVPHRLLSRTPPPMRLVLRRHRKQHLRQAPRHTRRAPAAPAAPATRGTHGTRGTHLDARAGARAALGTPDPPHAGEDELRRARATLARAQLRHLHSIDEPAGPVPRLLRRVHEPAAPRPRGAPQAPRSKRAMALKESSLITLWGVSFNGWHFVQRLVRRRTRARCARGARSAPRGPRPPPAPGRRRAGAQISQGLVTCAKRRSTAPFRAWRVPPTAVQAPAPQCAAGRARRPLQRRGHPLVRGARRGCCWRRGRAEPSLAAAACP